jgi:hypothetical protein
MHYYLDKILLFAKSGCYKTATRNKLGDPHNQQEASPSKQL